MTEYNFGGFCFKVAAERAGGAPVEDAQVEDAPAEDAPAGDAPVGDAPVGDAPAGDPLAKADRVAVLVFQGGAPFLDLHGAPLRKLFPATAKPERIERFCRRFGEDEAFRTGTILKHAFACC